MTPANVSSVAGSTSKLPLRLRWLGLTIGVLTLAWLPLEDTRTYFLTVLSLLWSVWTAGWLSTRLRMRAWLTSGGWAFVMLGAAAGLLSAPAAFGLVIFKAGLHAHGFVDFSFSQLTQLLIRTPIWVAAGGVVGWVVFHFRQKLASNND